MRSAVVVAALALSACSQHSSATNPDMALQTDPLVAARPYGVTLPSGHDRSKLWPLVIVLHGYTVTGVIEDAYLGISAQADTQQAVVAYPDGTLDAVGNPFWNATDACCNFGQVDVDDVAYLTAVIKDAIPRYSIDPKKVFLVGHSNGAFMAHRMACDRAELVAGIVALAGDVWKDMSKCQPSQPVAVAQVHGDADETILFDGGQLPMADPYPSALATFAYWQSAEGCTAEMDDPTMLDLEATLPGAETTISRGTGCTAGGASELWRIHGAHHAPSFTPLFVPKVYDFLYSHARPQ